MISPTSQVDLFINDNKCQACKHCLARDVCKVKAIVRIDRGEPPFIDMHRCYGCMLCLIQCPFEAIEIQP